MADVCGIIPSNVPKAAILDGSETRPATFGHLSFAAGQTTVDTESYVQSSYALPHAQNGDFEKGVDKEGKELYHQA